MAETSSSTSNNGSVPILKLAPDHLFTILLLLPIDSILSFSMSCKRFRSLACSDSLWESICRRDWEQKSVDALKSVYHHHERQLLPWMSLYEKVYKLDSVYCHKLSDPDGEFMVPSPRASHSLNFVSDCLVLFGGGCEGEGLNQEDNVGRLDKSDLKRYSRRDKSEKTIMQSVSGQKSSLVPKDTGRHLDDTWVAHTGKDFQRMLKWQKVTSGVPSGRFGHTCVVIDNYLVLFGGINDRGDRLNDTWVGQVSGHDNFGITLSWRLLDVVSSVPPPRGAHASSCIDNQKMVIHGGIGMHGVRLDDTWVLELSESLQSGTWHQIVTSPSPPARSGHTLTCIREAQLVLFGGRGLGYDVLNDIWLLEMNEDHPRWIQILYDLWNVPKGASLPRVGHSATLILGDKVLIYGGEDSCRHRKDDFWVLDVNKIPSIRVQPASLKLKPLFTGMWKGLKAKGYKPNCRSFHRACVDHSGWNLYVFGGMVDGLLQPAESSGLRFDGELFLVDLVL